MNKENVVICTKCNGNGVHFHDELINYHKREYITYKKLCHGCGGTGLQTMRVTTEYFPFKPYEPDK